MHKTPKFKLTINGDEFKHSTRLETLTLTDNSGFEADNLVITLDDSDGMLAIPEKDAEVELAIGFSDGLLIEKGKFVVSEVTLAGSPDKMTITAVSADFKKGFSEQRNKSYPGKTISSIVSEIAGRYGLDAKVHSKIAGISIKHIDQSNESDAHFLTRIAKQHKALASVKNGAIVVVPKGIGETASGGKIEVFDIVRKKGDNHQYRQADRNGKITGVRAFYHDYKKSKKKKVEVGKKGYYKQIRTTFQNQAEAKKAAEAKFKEIKRGEKSFSLALAVGIPKLFPQTPIKIIGYKPQIEAINWYLDRITHTISKSGYTCNLECKVLVED